YEGVSYSTLVISSNGWLELGAGPGFSDFSNDCLPTSVHTGPLGAAYWDDLIASSVRYETLGNAPNRVFVVTWDASLFSGGANADFEVAIHEGSNVISVKYFDVDPNSSGQGATIGFQHAG